MHHEPWLTALFNDNLAGIGNTINGLVGRAPQARPWETYIVMELLVAAFIIVLFAMLKPSLSMARPGKLQHLCEEMYNFLHHEAHDNIGHHSAQYVPLLGAIFVFILFSNLIGVIPAFESPTMFPAVPLGIALISFLFYNVMGVKEHGGKYFAHFLGPIPALAPLMVLIEIVSHLARPMSLTIRLYANMYAGEQVTMVFLGMTYLVMPAVFMGMHVFVSFLQAYVFTLLTMIYLGSAVSHDH